MRGTIDRVSAAHDALSCRTRWPARRFETSLMWANQLCQDLANAKAAQAAGDVKSEQQHLNQYDETATDQTGKTLTAAQPSILVQLASHL